MLNKLIKNNPIIQKLKFFGEKPEIKEAEKFEDWFPRLNPDYNFEQDQFNEFQLNIRKQTYKNYGNTEDN
jgi:hypothetical protein